MEENNTKRQILPEDIAAVSEKPKIELKAFVNKKSLMLFGLITLIAISGIFATNTNLFKGNITFDPKTEDLTISKEVKMYSLFKQNFINAAKQDTENNLIFIVKGEFPASSIQNMINDTEIDSPNTTQLSTQNSLESQAILEPTEPETTNLKQALEPVTTTTEFAPTETATMDMTAPATETNLDTLNVNKMANGDSFFNTEALQGNMLSAAELGTVKDPIRSISLSEYEYKLLIGKEGQKSTQAINLNENILLGSSEYKLFSVNVNQYTDYLTAGTWQATLVATEKTSGQNFTTNTVNFEVVTLESAYNRPINLEASYSTIEGIQYRMILNPVLVQQSLFKEFMDSNLESATIKLTPINGSAALSFPIANADLKLLSNGTDFPVSTDNKISLAELTAATATGEYNMSVDLKFDFGASDNIATLNSTLTTSTNSVLVNVAAAPEVPPVAVLTCNDRLAASAISISPASHNFGQVERNKNSQIDIVVTKSTGQTFSDLRFIINDDANVITARIGDKALTESLSSANSLFAIATNLTINVDFKPSRASSYSNSISIYDPRVPATCDPIAVIELQGQGINAPQETSNEPDEGIGYINDQRQILEPAFNPGAAQFDYYANAYNYVPEALPVVTEPNHTGTTSAPTAVASTDPMPIAETGPGLLLYPALMAASAFVARRLKK